VNGNLELQIAAHVERQLATLLLSAPSLAELPITPLRGVGDLVRFEIALKRFAEIHRSKRSKMLIGRIRRILQVARARLRAEAVAERPESRGEHTQFSDTQPAA
jgi:hypothetical protein